MNILLNEFIYSKKADETLLNFDSLFIDLSFIESLFY